MLLTWYETFTYFIRCFIRTIRWCLKEVLVWFDRYTCCVLNPCIGGNKSAVCSPRPFAMRLWDVLWVLSWMALLFVCEWVICGLWVCVWQRSARVWNVLIQFVLRKRFAFRTLLWWTDEVWLIGSIRAKRWSHRTAFVHKQVDGGWNEDHSQTVCLFEKFVTLENLQKSIEN